MNKAEKVFNKVAGYTDHGREMELGRTKAMVKMRDTLRAANDDYPGIALLKGYQGMDTLYTLMARKQAYKATLDGLENIKSHVPFVGMGAKGKQALADLESAIKSGE